VRASNSSRRDRPSGVTALGGDAASVTGSVAGIVGGGIFNDPAGKVFVCSDLVAISPNDPDDPPETLPCT